MTASEIAKKYKLPPATVAEMLHDGVLLTELMTSEQVAARYQTSTKNIYKLVRAGDLPARRLKGSRILLFDPTEIEVTTTPPIQEKSNVLELKR